MNYKEPPESFMRGFPNMPMRAWMFDSINQRRVGREKADYANFSVADFAQISPANLFWCHDMPVRKVLDMCVLLRDLGYTRLNSQFARETALAQSITARYGIKLGTTLIIAKIAFAEKWLERNDSLAAFDPAI